MSSWANVEGEEERRTTTIVQSIVENIFLVCIVLSAFAGSADKHRRSVCPSVAVVSVCSYSRREQIVCRNVCKCALSAILLLRRQNTIADFLYFP